MKLIALAILKSPIAWAVLAALGMWGAYKYQGDQLQSLRTQHAETLLDIAKKATAAERALRVYMQDVQAASKQQAQRTAHHDQQTATQLENLGAAAQRERTARLREQSALAGFVTRHRDLAARAATPQQCATAGEQATTVLADLYRGERESRAAVGKHADDLHIRLAGCTGWADDTANTINAGPQGQGMTP